MGNSTIIITGANNGIGFHMAASLLEDQYRVAVFDLSEENLTELKDRYPDKLLFCQCDVTRDADVKKATDRVLRKWNRIDILVNNACKAMFSGFEMKTVEQARNEFDINYFGYVRMISAVLPHMKARRTGSIHNMSSGIGLTGFPGLSGYASSKAAIETLTRTLSLEFSQFGICFTTMHPPLTNTKSSRPLGVPSGVMADPSVVGKKLAKKILSTKSAITPDLQTSLFLFIARRHPNAIGKLFSKMAQQENN